MAIVRMHVVVLAWGLFRVCVCGGGGLRGWGSAFSVRLGCQTLLDLPLARVFVIPHAARPRGYA